MNYTAELHSTAGLTLKKFICRSFSLTFLSVFIPIFIGIILYNPLYILINKLPENHLSTFSIYIATLILSFCSLLTLNKCIGFLKNKVSDRQYIAFITLYFISVFIFTVSVCLARLGALDPGVDSTILWSGAQNYLENGRPLIGGYLKRYFNNLPNLLQLIAEGLLPWKLTGSKEIVVLSWLIFDAFYITSGLFYLYLTMRRLFCRRLTTIALLCMAPFLYFCTWEGFWYGWAYNATPSFLFMNLSIYLVVSAYQTNLITKKMLLYCMTGISMMFASFLRFISFYVLIAIALHVLLFEARNLKQKMIIIILLLLPSLSMPGIIYDSVDRSGMFRLSISKLQTNEIAANIYHYILMGADQSGTTTQGWQPGPRGHWNPSNGFGNTPEQREVAIQAIKTLFNERGASHYLKYYYLKLLDIYTNSAFIGFSGWATRGAEELQKAREIYSQPDFDREKTYQSAWLHFIRKYVIEGVYPAAKGINYFCWTIIMTGLFMSIFFFRNLERNPACLIMWLVIIFTTMYLMIFEAYMRMLMPFAGFYIIASVYGLREFFQYSEFRKDRLALTDNSL